MNDLSEDSNPLLKLARTLGKASAKVKKELGLEAEAPPLPEVKNFPRPVLKMASTTPKESLARDLGRAHGISVENKTDAEILREINLKLRKKAATSSKENKKDTQ